jgi:uncharacterized protein YkwD
VRTSSIWLGLLLAPALLVTAPRPAHAGGFEDAVLAELNRVRTNPQAYAQELRGREITPANYAMDADDGLDQEDPEAVADAIDYLMRQRPLPPLTQNGRLAAAADEHVATQGPTGEIGHGPPGNFAQRMRDEGVFAGIEAESISYGQPTPRDVIRQLIVDSGVPSRGHRKDLLGSAFQAAGVGCGRHAEYGSMCVIDLAGAMMTR